MTAFWIWGAALIVYGAFSLWYNNWKGPLTPTEVDAFIERIAEGAGARDPEREAAARAFLEADDGGEFFMLNLIRLREEPVAVDGGEPQPADRVLERYTGYFMPDLFKRAGHPIFAGPAAGRYLEHWGVEPDPGWTFSAVVRYRSRRDMMVLATDPGFAPAHAYKIAAMANTLAFPVAPAMVFFGPRVWVALALALLASTGHLATQAWRSG